MLHNLPLCGTSIKNAGRARKGMGTPYAPGCRDKYDVCPVSLQNQKRRTCPALQKRPPYGRCSQSTGRHVVRPCLVDPGHGESSSSRSFRPFLLPDRLAVTLFDAR